MDEKKLTDDEAFIAGIVINPYTPQTSSILIKIGGQVINDYYIEGAFVIIYVYGTAKEYCAANVKEGDFIRLGAKIRPPVVNNSEISFAISDKSAILFHGRHEEGYRGFRRVEENEPYPKDTRTVIISGEIVQTVADVFPYKILIKDSEHNQYCVCVDPRSNVGFPFKRNFHDGDFVKIRATITPYNPETGYSTLELANEADIIEHRSAADDETEK